MLLRDDKKYNNVVIGGHHAALTEQVSIKWSIPGLRRLGIIDISILRFQIRLLYQFNCCTSWFDDFANKTNITTRVYDIFGHVITLSLTSSNRKSTLDNTPVGHHPEVGT